MSIAQRKLKFAVPSMFADLLCVDVSDLRDRGVQHFLHHMKHAATWFFWVIYL